jgi:cytochrome c554/c'-like protein
MAGYVLPPSCETTMRFFRDAGHLIRPAAVLLAGLALFVVVRSAVIPKAFGQYGHYRPAALASIRQRQPAFAGQATCVLCHEDEAKARAAGKHAHVACEACHGPQAKHADDPVSVKPTLPEVAALCRRCHEKDAAKPKTFPQVVTAEHSGGVACNTCHQPHSPQL